LDFGTEADLHDKTRRMSEVILRRVLTPIDFVTSPLTMLDTGHNEAHCT